MVNMVIAFMGEVAYISLIKKVRPELNADPLVRGFKRDIYDKLDENEKIRAGKAGAKTISVMGGIYAIVFVVCFLLVIFLVVCPIIYLPLVVLLLVHTVVYAYYSCTIK